MDKSILTRWIGKRVTFAFDDGRVLGTLVEFDDVGALLRTDYHDDDCFYPWAQIGVIRLPRPNDENP